MREKGEGGQGEGGRIKIEGEKEERAIRGDRVGGKVMGGQRYTHF